jgi:hypothetical protein
VREAENGGAEGIAVNLRIAILCMREQVLRIVLKCSLQIFIRFGQ